MRYQSSKLLPYSEEWWRVTLSSIGDAVIVTNREAKVAFMNPVAESLTGWTNSEATDKSLEDVFQIINASSRAVMENPANRVLQTGTGAALANNTLLVSRNGTEIAISDSAAPIRDDEGNVFGVVLVFRDATRDKQAQTARAYLASIIESSYDAIVGKTLRGVITSWNKAAEHMFGYSAEEALGRQIYLIIPSERHSEETEILARLERGERIDHYETIRQRKDGTRINVSLTVSPIRDGNGNIIGASKIARDITEQKHAEAEMRKAHTEAEAANRLKDEFLATVSHELRTPLNSILGWARLLNAGQLDEASSARALQTIERSALAQGQIIEDILDVSRIITGKLRLDVAPVEVGQLASDAVQSMRPTAEAKGVRLQAVLDTKTCLIWGDAQRLQQIVWNLLSNAIKFTPKDGRVQLTLSRNNSHVEIRVSDTGKGIRREFLPHVFERFRQADSSTTRTYGGLGLGLAIVRHLTELHGGSVTADSAGEDQGATFTVALPVAVLREGNRMQEQRLEDSPPSLGQRTPAGEELLGVRVLAVDDEPDACELLQIALQQSGAEVRVCNTAQDALEILREWKPDVLLSDIGMPGEDGYELIRQVRSLPHKEGGSIPAAALTAYATPKDRLKVLTAGFQTHLPKPVEPLELTAVVAVLSGKRGTASDK